MRVSTIARWSAITLLVAALAVPAVAVTLTGHTVVEVDGQSMEPTYLMGDVVTIRPAAPSDLVVGAVVTVQRPEGDRYTHRVVQVAEDGSLLLRGDNNEADDPATVPVDRVIGVVDGHLGGFWATLALQSQDWPLRVCLLAIVVALIFVPVLMPGAGSEPHEARPEGRRRADRTRGRRSARTEPKRTPAEDSATGHPAVALELMDSIRSETARVLLSSDRRLVGEYTVTTTQSSSDFPDLHVVIDISEKIRPRDKPAAHVDAAVGQVPVPVRRRDERMTAAVPFDNPGSVAAQELLWSRTAGSIDTAVPTRRSARAAQEHGRRRATR
ncbi:signal peptidase I [Amnibacterium flavum]|uniref:Signal peptidase I n=1 Tax=Amnibacterium flavum TaxID=2173173 RepID=A0A2V1HXP3_9MICO|nr:signal peptidase I [Amnibacterium flavum]PVZ95114.1 signal peptidase I [Amnibacterium flavum]